MKKLFVIFALFALFFAVSCEDDSSKKTYDEAQDEDQVKNAGELGGECLPDGICNEGLVCNTEQNLCVEDEAANTDNDTDTNTDANTDTNDDDTEQGATRYADCDPKPENAVWNDDGADGKFLQTFDGGKWTPEKQESTFSETPGVCVFNCEEDSSWNDSECVKGLRKAECTGLPENAEWNKASSITQTWDEEKKEWGPSNKGTYNSQESEDECHFKCKENYSWKESDSSCKPETRTKKCTGNPENSYWNTADEISQTWNGTAWEPSEIGTYSKEPSDTQCFFICKSGLTYDEVTSKCAAPCDKCATAEHALGSEKCIETAPSEYSCECEKPYFWDGTKCKMMPECSPAKVTPCRNGNDDDYLIWSNKAPETMTWAKAQTYCKDELKEGGFNDWRLPNIDELRTLILSCPNTMPGGSCAVTDPDCLSLNSCYTDATCSCSEDLSGKYSVFEETDILWSSSKRSDQSGRRWRVDFDSAKPYTLGETLDYGTVRCVR